MGNKIEYQTGQSVNGAMFIKEIGVQIINGQRKRPALFICCCGAVFENNIYDIRQKDFATCGCWSRLLSSIRNSTHGFWGHELYSLWSGMVGRCSNPKSVDYKNYGGRGIKVCEEWRRDPFAFADHVKLLDDYGGTGMTLDRIDNDGDYEPGNVRWATRLEQAHNKRGNPLASSGYRGVYYHKLIDEYYAYIKVDNDVKKIGRWRDKKVALNARNRYIVDNNLISHEIQEWIG